MSVFGKPSPHRHDKLFTSRLPAEHLQDSELALEPKISSRVVEVYVFLTHSAAIRRLQQAI